MSTTSSPAPLRFRGYNSRYIDIATRGTDESLAVSIEYAVHPSNVGCFIVRFVAHGKGAKPANYKHLTFRESAKFVIPSSESKPSTELFKGLRLNKVAIPAFKPAVNKYEADKFATKFGIWPMLVEWVAEQATEEGFALNLPQAELIDAFRSLTGVAMTPEDEVKSVVEFPKLDAPEQVASALQQAHKPEPEEDEDIEDEDGDEEDEEKSWLN